MAIMAVAMMSVAGCGDDSDGGGPNPQPAFYLTAANAKDLNRQAYDAGAVFARSQGPGGSLLVLDFGAARLRKGNYGSALRSGTFFDNERIRAALQEASRGYADYYEHGSVTIVYANSNALLSRPGPGYTRFDPAIAREAGEEQARTVAALRLPAHQSASTGGDVEPGYDLVGSPEVSIALVAGANSGTHERYFDFGTAPCARRKCVNGWTPEDICEVASGPGRAVLPEIYFEDVTDQPAQWAAIQKACKIDLFAGVSSSPAGSFSPQGSWEKLRTETPAGVRPIIVVWPGALAVGGGGSGHRMSATIPAQIDPQPQTFISSDAVSSVTNGWRAGSHERFTEVDAGALATDRSTGALVIFRHDYPTARQDVKVVRVKNAGPLRITKAPTGAGVEASAQEDGQIGFAGAHGVQGMLHLSDDSVTLSGG
jgi:hypothetical protein